MNKYIKIGSEEVMPVCEVYSYIYDSGTGKQVLRIIVDPAVATYDQLMVKLKDTKEVIGEYWDEEVRDLESGIITGSNKVLKTEHKNYSKDYRCYFNYSEDYPDKFFIELTRESQEEIQTRVNQENLNATGLGLVDLYENLGI